MQTYGQTGVGAPTPPPPEPPKKKGGKGLMIVGIILLIVGLILMVVGWPMFGTDSPKDIQEKIESGDLTVGDSFKMKGKVSDSTSLLGISVIYLEDFEMETEEYDAFGDPTGETTVEPIPLATSGSFSKGDTVIVEGDVGGLEYEVYKVPGGLAIFGIILLLVGVILAIVGVVKGKKKAKEAAPPVGAPPPPPPPNY